MCSFTYETLADDINICVEPSIQFPGAPGSAD